MSKLMDYLCILPDYPDAQVKRLEVRAGHLENAKKLHEEGTITYAGAMIEQHLPDGQVPSFKGSVIVVRAESEEQCRAMLEKDAYVASNVWDMSKAQITAFKVAFTPK